MWIVLYRTKPEPLKFFFMKAVFKLWSTLCTQYTIIWTFYQIWDCIVLVNAIPCNMVRANTSLMFSNGIWVMALAFSCWLRLCCSHFSRCLLEPFLLNKFVRWNSASQAEKFSYSHAPFHFPEFFLVTKKNETPDIVIFFLIKLRFQLKISLIANILFYLNSKSNMDGPMPQKAYREQTSFSG